MRLRQKAYLQPKLISIKLPVSGMRRDPILLAESILEEETRLRSMAIPQTGLRPGIRYVIIT